MDEKAEAWFMYIEGKYGFGWAALKGKSRTKPLCIARHHLMWGLRTDLGLSLKEIGYLLHRDHSTVIAGVKKHQSNRAKLNRGGARSNT